MNNIQLNLKIFFKLFYVLLLISIAIKFFSIGYDNYNQVMKISGLNDTTQKLKNNENIENINDTQNIILNLPYKIREFGKNYTWVDKNNNNNFSLGKSNDIEISSFLNELFGGEYDLDKVVFTKEVPGFYANEMPKNISYIKDTNLRKKLFISIVLPLIVETNRGITLKRDRLQKLYNKLKVAKTLTINEHNWLVNLAIEYSVKTKHIHKIDIAKELLKNIDIIPNSIAIAQAAKESGWGTSRFAQDGNALFGQWTYNDLEGILPSERQKGEGHLVKSFPNLKQSVISYMENINSHKAYSSFREKRLELRNNNKSIDPFGLVHELSPYAESINYTEILELIIKTNKLYLFDNIKLIDKGSLV